ncbi:hypothetical protein PR202_ga11377 [Eleusine coracana subsp. coracana]|uniref:CBM20 domain-containing protein n=1 Tax=Eleusine coracana subsp. coracana TaxID=191504 RepID=A0AAV5C986_ELECO|nr:hypothetical protein PR202_ga11377 [Eleusine coracana subsp. coracana]
MGTSGSKGSDSVAGVGDGGVAAGGGAVEAAAEWHGGAQLYVSLKMENARISGDLVPHVFGSEPIIGSWDPHHAVRPNASALCSPSGFAFAACY